MLVNLTETHKVEIQTPSYWLREFPEINVTTYLNVRSPHDIHMLTFANNTIRFVKRESSHNIKWGEYKPIEKEIYRRALARFKAESLSLTI